MAPERVVLINDDAAERGGAAAIALASARLLHERGVAVTFLSGDGGAPAPDLAARGIPVVSLGGRHILDRGAASALWRGLFDPATAAALSRWIDAHDTPGTVYHLHNWHKVLSPSVFPVLRRVASRLLITAHDYFLSCPNGAYYLYPQQRECPHRPNGARCLATACDRRNYGHKLWRVARRAWRHRLFDLTESEALVVAVHEAMVPLLTRGPIARGNIAVLRNPVTPWRADRVAAERNRDVLFVGRMDHDKGADLAARAARAAGVRLRLIGDGPLGPEIARNYPEAERLGWRTRDEIAEIAARARLVVSPSRARETFGLVVLEALTSGIPVIVSRHAALADEILAGGFGAACDAHDEPALVAAIATLAQDDRLVAAMSRKAAAAAGRLAPTAERWCDALLALYAGRLGASVSRRVWPLREAVAAAADGAD